jgi:uncharacterized damage-inducible protein DinB
MSDAVYTTSPGPLPRASTIGAHFRHVLEHIQLLLDGMDSGLVNYDLRKRDPRIEGDREFAVRLAEGLCARLEALDPASLDAALTVVHHTCPNSEPHQAASSRARELMFVLSHTNHHWALVRLLVELHQDTVPASFGFMPSTVRHLNSLKSIEGKP